MPPCARAHLLSKQISEIILEDIYLRCKDKEEELEWNLVILKVFLSWFLGVAKEQHL